MGLLRELPRRCPLGGSLDIEPGRREKKLASNPKRKPTVHQTKTLPLPGGRLRDTQQLFQLCMLPGAKQLYGVGTVRLQRVKNVGTSLRAVAAVAIVERVTVVVEREHPAIGLHRHQTAIDLSPRLLT